MAVIINNIPILRHLVDAMSDLTTASIGRWTIVDLALLTGDHRALEILFQKDRAMKPSPWTCSEFHDVPSQDIDPSKAKELVAFCTSRALTPPPDLYETYAYVLLSLAGTHHVGSSAIMTTLLIDDVFQAFYNAAGITTPASRVTPCQPCVSFQRFPGKPNDWFQIHQSRADLEECAQSCPLCRLITEAFDNAEEVAKKEAEKEAELIKRHNNGECGWMCSFCRERESKNEYDHILIQDDTAGSSIRLTLRSEEYPIPYEIHTHPFLIAEDKHTRVEVNLPIDAIDEAYIPNTNTPVGLDISTGSRQSFDIATRWLNRCRRSSGHEDCQKAYSSKVTGICPELPTRILDLTSFSEPRLVETNGTRSAYCALSYCWGDIEMNTTTTCGNVSTHRDGIPTASLPVFIQEALVAARTLGYQYIWIDALCIIQDDPTDWDKEASKMKDVYSNADLTISSLVASGCHEHLFQSRGASITRPVPFDTWTPKDKRRMWKKDVIYQNVVYPSFLFNNGGDPEGFSGADNLASKAPITSRGWVLQEQMLSTRILYFGSNQLVWECLCFATTDSDPSKVILPRMGGGLGMHRGRKHALQGLTHPNHAYDPEATKYQPFGIWQSLLTSYTKRHLTKSSDRIPAFLAISKSLESAIGDKFIAGVWKGKRLLESLSWNVRDASAKHPQKPSWSWAGVGQPIDFDCLRQGYNLAVPISLAAMVSFNVHTDHSQSNISGSITLRGTLHQKEVNIASECKGAFFDYQEYTINKCYALDLVGFEREVDDYYNSEDSDNEQEDETTPVVVIRLLLKSVNRSDSSEPPCTFRRIGICRDEGTPDQILDDVLLPRENTDGKGIWSGIVRSEADKIVVIV